jgi:hypothetical protein
VQRSTVAAYRDFPVAAEAFRRLGLSSSVGKQLPDPNAREPAQPVAPRNAAQRNRRKFQPAATRKHHPAGFPKMDRIGYRAPLQRDSEAFRNAQHGTHLHPLLLPWLRVYLPRGYAHMRGTRTHGLRNRNDVRRQHQPR